jgi:1-acyl-sn-glycerol-3-phosphate acyltransferase
MIRLGLAEGADRFEPIAVGLPHSWKFRGQVVPTNRLVTVLLGLTRVERQERAAFGDASLWVDGLRIYEARGLAMRAVREPDAEIEVLAPSTHPWLKDHCPTFTVPALPLMSMVDRLAAAVARKSRAKVIAVEDAQVHRWLPIAGAVRLKTEVVQCGARSWDATLLSWREASRAELSRFEPVATARVSVGDEWPPAEEMPWAPPSDARPVPDPYQSGDLFHGPSLQVLRKLARGASGATALLRASATGAPHGLLNEALLDGLTHSIPHDSLAQWSASIEPGFVAYPSRVVSLRVYAQLPREGEVRCETRFAGFEGEDPRRPRCRVQAIVGDRVVAALDLVETLFPKGPLGCAPPCERRAFLRDRTFVAGLRLSDERDGVTVLPEESVRQSDWLPGTVAHAFATRSADPVSEIAAKEHVAARACVHPATVEIRDGSAHCQYEPLNTWPLQIEREASFARVRETGPVQLDLKPVREYWDRHFGIGRWPVEDLFYSLAQRFLRRVRVEPETLDALRGRGVLYLANHQVAVESLLFSVVLSGLTGVPTVTLAKAEHRQSWLGLLIKHAFSYPGVTDPGVITFFDRGAQGELPKVVHELAGELKGGKKSVMVHVEGTRALRSRAKVEKMSGAFLDMAVATGTPVVPVRFAGGLPIELVSTRLEFPVGMCRQDFIVGRPIAPGELVSLSYKARKERVLAAINALMPEQESPGEADPILAAEVGAWAAKTGASHEHSVLFQALRSWPAPCGQTQKLLEALERGQLPTGSSPANLWLVELARRLSSRVCDILPS